MAKSKKEKAEMKKNTDIGPEKLSDDNDKDISVDEETETEQEETDPIKILEKKLQKAEVDSKNSHDRLLRATAEFDNYKKRSERELGEFRKFANERLIKDLLPVMDNLERAVESSTKEDASSGIIEGVEMTLKEIYKVLENFNLKCLESEGKVFDPNFHQAVLQEETDDYAENTVIKVMQKGYILHDRLIRPAMVVVAKATSKEVKNGAPSDAPNDKVDQ